MTWKHTPRHCIHCGKVGPRVIVAGGWSHSRCLTVAEMQLRRKLASRPNQATKEDGQ